MFFNNNTMKKIFAKLKNIKNDKDEDKKDKNKKISIKKDSKELQQEMLDRRISNIPDDIKFDKNQIKRLSQKIKTSIFDKNQCAIWEGYFSSSKGEVHILFYHRKKKLLLHRLLYMNFVGDLGDNENVKTNCKNGTCCNVNHMIKYEYKNANRDFVDNYRPLLGVTGSDLQLLTLPLQIAAMTACIH